MSNTNEQALVPAEPIRPPAVVEFSAFGNISHFENAQRMAKALSSSSIVPIAYQGDQNIGSCVIALEISNRIGASVLAVMQNLYVVHGKPGWSSQFLISCVNASRKFSPLRYKMTGTKGSDDWGCIAWATDRTGEALESPEVTIGMAKAEGWYAKNGSKWKTMPELMLRYRTATLFARLYAPELTMGIQTTDEVQDFIDVEAIPALVKAPQFPGPPQLTRGEPTKATKATKKAKEAPAAVSTPQEPESAPEATTEPPDDLSFESVPEGERPELVNLIEALEAAEIDANSEVAVAKVIRFCHSKNLMIKGGSTLDDIKPDKYAPLTRNIKMGGPIIDQIKGME